MAATKNTTGGKVNWNEYPGAPAAAKAQEAMDMAKSNCLKRWDTVHPDQKGKGSCRMVGVGVVATPTTHNYDGHGFADPSFWQNAWNKLVKPGKYSNNNKAYATSSKFTSDPGYNVDKLASSAWANSPVVIVIALSQSEPSPTPPQKYKLTVSTKASGRFGTAGGTNPVTDAITLNNNANSKEKVTGQITLTAITLDGKTHVSPLKRFTTSVASTVNVKFKPGDVVKSWTSWPAGEYWFDVAIPKQQHMEAEARHNGRNDKNESWKAAYKLTITTKASGHTLTGGAKPVSDPITLSNNGMASQTVNGTITLNVKTTSGTLKKAKAFTGKTDGSTKVSFKPADVHKDWATWPIGSYWYDVTIPKQQGMNAAANHAGQNDANESWKVTGYKLTISTKATGHTLTGGSKPVSDTITLSNDGNANDTVNGTITLNANTTSGTKTKTKKFTGKTNGDTKVLFTPKEVNKNWTAWQPGDYWYDVTIPKQGNMSAAANHKGQNDPNESWKAAYKLTISTKTSGHTLTGGS